MNCRILRDSRASSVRPVRWPATAGAMMAFSTRRELQVGTDQLAAFRLCVKGDAIAEPALEFVAVLATQIVDDHGAFTLQRPAPGR